MRWLPFIVALVGLVGSAPAGAQRRVAELSYTPTARAQIAIWVETGEGVFLRTFRLTEATARRGIGNRPGATQMDSGYHWPYGRREGVLPIWAHRRLTQEGAEPFRRVIFQDRTSEGYASQTSQDDSPDDYYCLSFNESFSSKETLDSIDPTVDAMACPTLFNSDKGRYVDEDDVRNGYAEPFAIVSSFEGGDLEMAHTMRPLGLHSLYPARRDLESFGPDDHPDARLFFEETRAAMPEIDAVSMATPRAAMPQALQFSFPAEWPDGEYVMYIEVNVEGDHHGAHWGPDRLPSPASFPEATTHWDAWSGDRAGDYGYPYRGQPTILYAVPFRLDASGGVFSVTDPTGYGELHGMDGDVRPLDSTIASSPETLPGSGADRLMMRGDGTRASLRVVPTNVCDAPMPPEVCFSDCVDDEACGFGFICHAMGCLDRCNDAAESPPAMPADLTATLDAERSWEFVAIHFSAPASERELFEYQVRVSTTPYEPGTPFETWGVEAKIAAAVEEALVLDPSVATGDRVEGELGHLEPEQTYFIGVRAVAECHWAGPVSVVEIETTAVEFATVSPCFVATATYGTPMAAEIGVLRRFRDRYLMNNAPGRALVDAYYELGPDAAAEIREDATLRAVSRGLLTPVVAFADWLLGD
ncbi:MAG: hypothetical protein JJ863_05600 [Deltaproteobacteria bacterium]|nr:hypothetical protein [Deltaproteobacteria bacterium]